MNSIVADIIGVGMSHTTLADSLKAVAVFAPDKTPISHVVITWIVNHTGGLKAVFRTVNVEEHLLVVHLKVKWIRFRISLF